MLLLKQSDSFAFSTKRSLKGFEEILAGIAGIDGLTKCGWKMTKHLAFFKWKEKFSSRIPNHRRFGISPGALFTQFFPEASFRVEGR